MVRNGRRAIGRSRDHRGAALVPDVNRGLRQQHHAVSMSQESSHGSGLHDTGPRLTCSASSASGPTELVKPVEDYSDFTAPRLVVGTHHHERAVAADVVVVV